MQIDLKLDLREVNLVLDLMGAQPTSTNIWPLAAKIRAQAEQQIPKEAPDAAPSDD
jgi:hypothetical protein